MRPIWEQEVDSDEAEDKGGKEEDWPACHVTSAWKGREGRTRALIGVGGPLGMRVRSGGSGGDAGGGNCLLSACGATGQRRAKPSNNLTN